MYVNHSDGGCLIFRRDAAVERGKFTQNAFKSRPFPLHGPFRYGLCGAIAKVSSRKATMEGG